MIDMDLSDSNMVPSSRKVKLSRAALKTPLRRKGDQKPQKNRGFVSINQDTRLDALKYNLLSGRVNPASIQEVGPFTRAKHRRNKPNTRSMSRLDLIRKMKFVCRCCCTHSTSTIKVKEKTVKHRVVPQGKLQCVQKRSIKKRMDIKPRKPYLTHIKLSKSVCKLTQGQDGKSCQGRMAKGGLGEVGQGQGTVNRSPGANVLLSASKPAQGRAEACSVSSELSSSGGHLHLISTTADSKRSVRRVAVYGCHLSGDSTHPKHSTVGRPQEEDKRFGSEKPMVNIEKAITKHNKIILWKDHYPKVTLCDISPRCVECSHNCSFVLSGVIKTKVVRCFAEEMRAGFRFEPGCLGKNKHPNNEHVEVNNKPWSSLQSELNPCQSENIKQQNRDLTNNKDPRAISTHFLREHTPKELCINDLHNKPTGNDAIPDQNLIRKETHVGKRLESNLTAGILSDAAHLASIASPDQSKNDYRYSDTTGFVNFMDCHSETDSSKRELFVQSEVCGSAANLRGAYREDKTSELNSLGLDNTDELDSFACQRVRVYSGKIGFSCARTYLRWPFSSSERSSAEPDGNVDCHAGHCDLITSSQNQQSSVTNGSSKPTNLPAQCTGQRVPISEVGGEENGVKERRVTSVFALKIAERCDDLPSDFAKKYLLHSFQRLDKLHDLPTCSTTGQDFNEKSNGKLSPSISYSSRSTPSPSELGLPDLETAPTISAVSSPNNGCLHNVSNSPSSLPTSSLHVNLSCVNLTQLASTSRFYSDNNSFLHSEETQMSSSLLPQDVDVSEDETFTSQSPPILEPYYKTSPFNKKLTTDLQKDCFLYTDKCVNTDLLLPPLLSPLNSPQKHLVTSYSNEYENLKREMPKHNMSENSTPEIVNGNGENCRFNHSCLQKPASPTNNDGFTKSCQKDVSQGNTESRQSPVDPEIMASPASDVLTESCSSSSDENAELKRDSQSSAGEEEMAEDTGVLDEISAYEKDILLVDVIQDDPDLFVKVPQKSLLKLGPARAREISKTGQTKLVKILHPAAKLSNITQRLTPVNVDFLCNSPSGPEDSPRRPWRPQCNSSSSVQSSTEKHTKIMGPTGGRTVYAGEERNQHNTTADLPYNHIPPLSSTRIGYRTTNVASMTDFRWQKSNAYCRQYFSESLTCGFKVCRFHHMPLEGDEKFCIETVARFVKNQACLHKAGAVFTGYYQNNPPGVYFSMPVLLSLLWALLKAGMLSEIFSVLRTSLAHKIVPEHEFLLDLFNFIREKGLMSLVPELMQLTFKMASAGLPLSLDCLDCVKNSPEFHQTPVSSNSLASFSGNSRSSTLPEYLNLAHAVVEIELCTKQEDWKRLGEVFQSICQSNQVNQVERISGRIAVALLSESKDKLLLPFAAFAETACHNVDEDSLIRSFLGRIGVSLMLRYQKTHQWAKGQKVVEVLSALKVSYATMKGLFGNEDSTSRCHLVSVATELFLLSGSVEGALNTLRENEWFVTSSMWPCEAADLEKRTHVLLRLAEKTSQRDTLEVLSNLPGLKKPNEHVDISRYSPFFSSHLQACVDRQILPVAADMVDFMLSKNLPVDHAMLQMLLHKLGKQNLWLRAREIFRHSVNEGYYPGVSAPSGFMALIVPSQLGEIELALTFEMFITVNATAILALPDSTTSSMSITLKRTKICESDYLSAGSRLLSAACITQPKLSVHYTAVNSSQEQVFTLDISSARRWLRHNHLWANDVWTL